MKRSKRIDSSSTLKLPRPPDASSRQQLAALQRLMADAIACPLTAQWKMRQQDENCASMSDLAASFIKPNDRLNSFERLEIYNRQYWFRLLDCLYDDYPGVRRVLGERRFMKLAKAYLVRYPSRSYSLRDLGDKLERFLRELRNEPEWSDVSPEILLIARETARFEWAQIVAFDGASASAITPDDVLGKPPSEIKLGLQPYLSVLELRYAVDEFSVAIKEELLRQEASQMMESAPKQKTPMRRVRLPQRKKIRLAVHRCDNVVYFKRLEPEAFVILSGLRRGFTLEQACEKALIESHRKNVDWPTKIRDWFSSWAQLEWLTVIS